MGELIKFGLIDPVNRVKKQLLDTDVPYAAASLAPGAVDHGVLGKHLAIIVSEYGLFAPPKHQAYFAYGQRLFAGTAILYGFNETGETIDVPDMEDALAGVRFLYLPEVEAEIAAGTLRRPTMSVNGIVTWQWPQPAPEGMGEPGGRI